MGGAGERGKRRGAVLRAVLIGVLTAWAASAWGAAPKTDEAPEPTTLPRPRLLWRLTDEGLKAPDGPNEKTSLSTDGVGVVIVEGNGSAFDVRTGRKATPLPRADATTGANIRVAIEGDSIRVYADKTTTPLWAVSGAAEKGKAYVDPVVTARGVFIVAGDEITRRDVTSGRVDRRWRLPTFLRKYVDGHDLEIVTDGLGFVLLPHFARGPKCMATGVDDSLAVTVLERPTFIGNELALLKGVIVFHDSYLGSIGAYDLTKRDPPLASLSAEAALASVRTEMGDDECDRLLHLPKLDAHWLRVLETPSAPSFHCALSRFEVAPKPRASAVLRRLADQRAKGTGSRAAPRPKPDEPSYRFVRIVRTVAADDSRETSRWLAALIESAPREAWTSEVGPDEWTWAVRYARMQLWRTGRTSELGLCPRQPSIRHVDALDRQAADGSIGAARPLNFLGAAPDGRWTVVCQGRTGTDSNESVGGIVGGDGDLLGDQMPPHLVVGSGPGWASDEFVSSDLSGRYVAVREGSCASVVDTRTNQVVTLSNADMRDNGLFGEHRAVAFDAAGTRLLYLRGGPKPTIVVRDLTTGGERIVDPGPGLVWTARFDPEGHGLEVTMIPSGGWPEIMASHAKWGCGHRETKYPLFNKLTPDGRLHYLPLDGGPTLENNDLLRMFDGGWLLRKKDGSIALRDASGVENVLAPAVCNGVVRHADATRRLLVVNCENSHHAASLWIFGAHDAKKIVDTYRSFGDSVDAPPERFAAIDEFYVDMDQRRVVSKPPVAPGRIRIIDDWKENAKGLFAERSDGAVLLRVGKKDNSWSPRIPDGPLVWRRPDRR